MYCIKCGTKLADDANFCINCGEKVQRTEQTNSENYEEKVQENSTISVGNTENTNNLENENNTYENNVETNNSFVDNTNNTNQNFNAEYEQIQTTQTQTQVQAKQQEQRTAVATLTPEQEIAIESNKVNKKDLPVEEVIDYLDKAKKLEIRKYSLTNALNKIRNRIKDNKIQSVSSKLYGYSFADAISTAFHFGIYAAVIGAIIGFGYQLLVVNETDFLIKVILGITCLFLFTGGFWEAVLVGLKWGAIAGGAVFALVFIGTFTFYIISKIRTKKAQKSQDDNVLKENLAKGERVKKLEKQERELMRELRETEKVLDKLYGLNVIYRKYRDLVAVTTIQEYFESGRCSSLYGFTGAYNIYENEVRQNTIISRLEDILVSLDQIKQGQYALFLAIQEGNRMMNQMLENSYATLNATKESAAQNRIAAENSKITAENTEILMYCEAFRK